MPLNLLKTYNSLLELDSFNESERYTSLSRIFYRDFIETTNSFRDKAVKPTPQEGKTTIEVLFHHLTTRSEGKYHHRVYDRDRSIRIHWIKFHLQEKKSESIELFSVKDKQAIRTYIYDEKESYIVVLEPKNPHFYYLITAFYIKGRNRYKIEKKRNRKLEGIF